MKHVKLFEQFDQKDDLVNIELSNSYILVGPKSTEAEARELVADMEKEMRNEYEQALENSGESAAMDARDDVYWESGYREALSALGYEMEQGNN